jgi:dTMP kinase
MIDHTHANLASPRIDSDKLSGKLIVIEGMDSSGRTTQISLLSDWLEKEGFAVTQTGLKRSKLVSESLEKAQEGNVLSPRTLSLFYATDFYDQLDNRIIPALKSGFVVLADRYIYTLMARDIVRGADKEWLKTLYAHALVPDMVFYLNVTWSNLLDRTLMAQGKLDYWESGMDIGYSRDWFDSFKIYQKNLSDEFRKLHKSYQFKVINANRKIQTIQNELRKHIAKEFAL